MREKGNHEKKASKKLKLGKHIQDEDSEKANLRKATRERET